MQILFSWIKICFICRFEIYSKYLISWLGDKFAVRYGVKDKMDVFPNHGLFIKCHSTSYFNDDQKAFDKRGDKFALSFY